MSLRTFDTELKVGSYVAAFLFIPAASFLRSPDFSNGVSDERPIRICFSGFHILWKRYLNFCGLKSQRVCVKDAVDGFI